MANKPPIPEPEPIERWTAQRKAAIIVEVMKGQISVPEAARKYGFTQNEYRRWADGYHRAGVEALKVNRKDQDARYEAEIKRLRAKIGQLVMDDDIRQEAMRPSFGRSDVERVVANGKRSRQRVCRLLNVARSTSYYRRKERKAIVDELPAQRIKRLIDDEPYLGYRMVWARLPQQVRRCISAPPDAPSRRPSPRRSGLRSRSHARPRSATRRCRSPRRWWRRKPGLHSRRG